MNRVELIDAIAAETGVTKKDIDAVIKSFTNVAPSFDYSFLLNSVPFQSNKMICRKVHTLQPLQNQGVSRI